MLNRREFFRTIGLGTAAVTIGKYVGAAENTNRPNIFIAISDDQSWPHTSAYGATYIQTTHFDRIAAEGVLFNNAFCASPGCDARVHRQCRCGRNSAILGRDPGEDRRQAQQG